MSLTQEQITRLAKLTALSPDTSVEIESVVASFDAIAAVDTSQISEISRSGNVYLTPRADTIVEDAALPDALLACSPQKIAAHQIVLSGIMHGE